MKNTGHVFEIYKDAGGQWRWRLVSVNGRIVADSAEAYANKANAKRAAELVFAGLHTFRVRGPGE